MEKVEHLLLMLIGQQEGMLLRLCLIESSIQDLKKVQDAPEELLDAEAVCKKLKIHRRTLDRHVQSDGVRTFRICGRNYYYLSDFVKLSSCV